MVKNLPANSGDARDMSSILGSGKAPGEGNGNALQASILAWKILWTEEPGRLQFIGSPRVGYELATEHTHLELVLDQQSRFFQLADSLIGKSLQGRTTSRVFGQKPKIIHVGYRNPGRNSCSCLTPSCLQRRIFGP